VARLEPSGSGLTFVQLRALGGAAARERMATEGGTWRSCGGAPWGARWCANG
jgi:hypothetical protein